MTFYLGKISVVVGGKTNVYFLSDHVFDVHASNDDIYCSVFKNLVASVMQGFNATIFAYGQTSSGKTHTILGSTTEAGLLERAVDDIFSNIRQNAQKRFLLRSVYLSIVRLVI